MIGCGPSAKSTDDKVTEYDNESHLCAIEEFESNEYHAKLVYGPFEAMNIMENQIYCIKDSHQRSTLKTFQDMVMTLASTESNK